MLCVSNSVLQPNRAGGSSGRVTRAEREAARGHGAFAICLSPGDRPLADALERRLFDHGCAVHVIEGPENLRQAVRTALAAGLAVIVVPSHAADWEILRQAAPADRLVRIDAAHALQGNSEDAAKRIWQDLEAAGRLGGSQSPLTGGAGI